MRRRPEIAYDHKASMLQDVEARRPTEIDFLNGGIAPLRPRARRSDAAERRHHRTHQGTGGLMGTALSSELERRHANVRAAMAEHDLDALVVSGSEYTGFEGAVTYLSGFQIVHRYAYVVVPADGEAFVVFPSRGALRRRARNGASSSRSSTTARASSSRSAHATAGWRRVGVYGLDYVMAVRDHQALDGLRPRRASTSSSTSRARSRARPSSSRCATRCASTSAGSRSSSRPTRRGSPRPR